MVRSLGLGVLLVLGSARSAHAEPVVQSEHANDQFGTAVVIEGDRLVVGAPGANAGAFDAGVVQVFERDGDEWRRDAELMADEPVAHGAFGGFLALGGDVLAIGAPLHPNYDVANRHGSAYMFERIDGVWEQRFVLQLEDVDADTFGVAAAIGHERAAFSAVSRRQGEAVLPGVVVVVGRDGDGWREEARIAGPEGSYSFGFTVAMDDDHMIVTTLGLEAYAYHREGMAWVGGEVLVAPTEEPVSIARLSGEWLVLGGRYSSKLHFFRRSGVTWSLAQALDIESELYSFDALALDGERAAVGVAGSSDGTGPQEVKVIEREGEQWQTTAEVTEPKEWWAWYGQALWLSKGRLAVADPAAGAFEGQSVGEVRIYSGANWATEDVVTPDSADEAGCGCQTRGGPSSLLGLVLLLGRRRRRCAD